MNHYLHQWINGFEYKIILSVICSAVTIVEGFYGELLWVFLSAFTIDFITGVLKSRKNNVPITSRRLRSSVTKLSAYMLLITAFLIASSVEETLVPVITVTYYYFIFTELKSIIENVEELGVKIPNVLKSKVNKHLEEDDKKEEK